MMFSHETDNIARYSFINLFSQSLTVSREDLCFVVNIIKPFSFLIQLSIKISALIYQQYCLLHLSARTTGCGDLHLKLKVPQTLASPIFMKQKNLNLVELCLLWCPSSFIQLIKFLMIYHQRPIIRL